ncbi:hypothetical protein OK016_09380 [Vibrio chagasii]|nr:hypothetical protein [Vibrio chagasii]
MGPAYLLDVVGLDTAPRTSCDGARFPRAYGQKKVVMRLMHFTLLKNTVQKTVAVSTYSVDKRGRPKDIL